MSGTRAPWRLGERLLRPDRRPLVMGIVNLTPDSFYPGSRLPDTDAALAAALGMVEEGADLLDVGAESSRPGAEPVGEREEQRRLLPFLEGLRARTDCPLTVDTWRAGTAARALDLGADGINDVSAGRFDPALLPLAAERGCGLLLMHMQGEPRTMQDDPRYDDVVAEVRIFLAQRCAAALAAGVAPERLAVDPGIGFGKLLEHNLALLAGLDRLATGHALVLGASRKGFIGQLSGAPVQERLPGSLAAAATAHRRGASVVRVHDVGATVQFLTVLAAIAADAGPDRGDAGG